MSCENCKSTTASTTSTAPLSGSTRQSFEAVFSRFWPPTAPFPPMAPYVAAAVSRADARKWAAAIGADRDPAVLSGDPMAVLNMVGRAMMDPGMTFSSARKRSKKKTPPNSPNRTCFLACEAECGHLSNCCGLGVGDDGWCRYYCCDGSIGYPDDIGISSTEGTGV